MKKLLLSNVIFLMLTSCAMFGMEEFEQEKSAIEINQNEASLENYIQQEIREAIRTGNWLSICSAMGKNLNEHVIIMVNKQTNIDEKKAIVQCFLDNQEKETAYQYLSHIKENEVGDVLSVIEEYEKSIQQCNNKDSKKVIENPKQEIEDPSALNANMINDVETSHFVKTTKDGLAETHEKILELIKKKDWYSLCSLIGENSQNSQIMGMVNLETNIDQKKDIIKCFLDSYAPVQATQYYVSISDMLTKKQKNEFLVIFETSKEQYAQANAFEQFQTLADFLAINPKHEIEINPAPSNNSTSSATLLPAGFKWALGIGVVAIGGFFAYKWYKNNNA